MTARQRIGAVWPIVFASATFFAAEPLALAREVWRADETDLALEFSGFYKTYGALLRMPEGLVDGLAAADDLFDELRLLVPAAQAETLPAGLSIPRTVALSTHSGWLAGELVGPWYSLGVGYQLGLTLASVAQASGATLLGGGLGSGAAEAAERRLADFEDTLLSQGGLRLAHSLDVLELKLQLPGVDLVVGRQALSWGSGHFWNPTDLLSPFAPTAIDQEVRRGVDALRLTVPLGDTGLIEALWLPSATGWKQGGVLRGRTNLEGFDLTLSAAKYVADLVLGGDVAGDLGDLSVHAEAAYTWSLTGLAEPAGHVAPGEHFLRAVAGLDWKPSSAWLLMAEYHYNGFGAADPADYGAQQRKARVTRGEVFGAGRHYLGLSAAWLTSDLLTVQLLALANLADPSVLLMPVAEYWFEPAVFLRLGGVAGLGRGPDPAELQRLAPADYVADPAGVSTAIARMGLQSEYGAVPLALFAQVCIYW